MKIYAYILIVLSGVLTAQCSKVTLDEICGYPSAPGGGNGEGEGNGDYNSYWYYSYEAAQLIDAETLAWKRPRISPLIPSPSGGYPFHRKHRKGRQQPVAVQYKER